MDKYLGNMEKQFFLSIVKFGAIIGDAVAFQGAPILKGLSQLCEATKSMQAYNLYKQTENFLIAFRECKISEADLNEYRMSLEANPEKMHEEIGRVLFFMEKNYDEQKSKNMAKIYAEYINKRLGYDQLVEMYDVNDRMFIKDYKVLETVINGQITNSTLMYSQYQFDRLIALGLLKSYDELYGAAMWRKAPSGKIEENKPTSFGKRFIEIVSDGE